MSRPNGPNVAFMEDCGEDDGSSLEGIEGTRKYAISEAPETPRRPEPNTSKSRSNDHQYHSSPVRRGESNLTEKIRSSKGSAKKEREEKLVRRSREGDREDRDDRQRKEELREKELRRQKAEERAAKESSKALRKVRPNPMKHSHTQPVTQSSSYRRGHDDPRAYGVQQPAPPGPPGTRPRANTRPASYYAGQPPPLPPPTSNMGYPPPNMPPPPPFPVGTFPPPPQMFPPGPPPMMHGMPPLPSPSGMQSYFEGTPPSHSGRDLRSRFETRPSSAMGFSPSARSYLQDEYGYDEEIPRRTSHARRPSHTQRNDDDRKRMPPPDFIPTRPRTTANPSAPFQAPVARPPSRHSHSHSQSSRPRPPQRRSMGYSERPGYDDEDFFVGSGDELFHDVSPEPAYGRRMAARRQSIVFDDDEEDEDEEEDDESDAFDDDSDEDGGDLELMQIKGRASRRGSMYSGALGSGGVSLDRDRYADALKYQDDVTGGPHPPLTAELLRKATKRGGVPSSRSTRSRSTASRDESDYRRSNTTGLTRSSSGGADESFTIKVSGGAVVRVQGAEIECDDGGEITFNGRPGAGRVGSDRASTVYQIEDSRSRVGQQALAHRPRAPSQSDSQKRNYPPSHAPYETAPYETAPYDPNLAFYRC